MPSMRIAGEKHSGRLAIRPRLRGARCTSVDPKVPRAQAAIVVLVLVPYVSRSTCKTRMLFCLLLHFCRRCLLSVHHPALAFASHLAAVVLIWPPPRAHAAITQLQILRPKLSRHMLSPKIISAWETVPVVHQQKSSPHIITKYFLPRLFLHTARKYFKCSWLTLYFSPDSHWIVLFFGNGYGNWIGYFIFVHFSSRRSNY